MREEMLRFLLVVVLFAGILLIASLSGEMRSYPADSNDFVTGQVSGNAGDFSSVSELLRQTPLDKQVSVLGEISRIMEDYVSKKGYEYQQFFITDGEQELKIFCSKYKGSVEVKEGDNVLIKGKFQKYYNTYEVYLDCRNVEIL
jgi:uncharacterized protein YdeI (BOF family)